MMASIIDPIEESRSVAYKSFELCPLCGKPFASSLSYNRHVSYCRRTKSRIRSRQKSCRSCSFAKAKCSFDTPCSRCSSRGLNCTYDDPPLQRSQTALSASALGQEDLQTLKSPDLGLDLTMPSIDLNHPLEDSHGWLSNWEEEVLTTNVDEGFSLSELVRPHSELSGHCERTIRNSTSGSQSLHHNTGFLSRLRAVGPVGQQTKRLIIEALCAVPEQMRRKVTFPSFIHPQWNSKNLLEPLAVCMRVAELFATHTSEIAPFIWRTILAEQRRNLELLPTLSKPELLAAIQAGIVYLIMRVIDGPTQSLEWNHEMAISQSILCDRFLEICNGKFCQSELSHPSVTWEDWIFAESRRRTSCVWFLITRTLVVNTKDGCPTTEQPWTLPLPSPKAQWEARTQEAWLEELQAGSPVISTFGSLMESKQRCNERLHCQRLNSWNARTDNLGSLLNIAVTVA